MKKPQPYSKEVEQAIIACMMLDPQTVDYVRSELSAEAFYTPKHHSIVELIYERHQAGMAVDAIGVIGGMTEEQLEKAGGVEYIASLVDILPDTRNIETYVTDAVRLYCYRKIISITGGIGVKAYEQDGDPELLIADLISSLSDVTSGSGDIKTLADVTDALYARQEKYHSKGLVGLATGWTEIDKYLSGMQPGLYVLAGRTGLGKTTTSLALAGNLAVRGARGLLCQFEGKLEGYIEKLICHLEQIPKYKMIFGGVSTDSFTRRMGELDRMGFRFIDKRMNAYALRAKVMPLKGQIDFMVIDQLSRIPRIKENEDEVLAIKRTMIALKSLADDMEIPIFLLAQINRSVESRSDKRPFLSDLKGSGSIEEEADVIMLLYRDDYHDAKTEDKGVMEVDVAKNRLTEVVQVFRLVNGESTKITMPTQTEMAEV